MGDYASEVMIGTGIIDIADPREKERQRRREREMLIQDIKHVVLLDIGSRIADDNRYRTYLAKTLRDACLALSLMPAAIAHAVLSRYSPERRIEEIIRLMNAPEGSDEWKTYWCGETGARVQAELRRLYKRREWRGTGKTNRRI